MLGSRGVDLTLIEDIVQDVALRALDKRVPFTDPDDLYRWAATTARHLHIDHVRTGGRTTGDDSLLAVADGTDVAHAAERRVALGQVWRALAVMRPRERDAILDSLHDREARSSQVLVRRHRARATLRKAVGGVLAWVTVARLRVREWAPDLQPASAAAVLAPVLAVGSAGLFAAAPPPAAETARPAQRVAEAPPARRVVSRTVARTPRAERPESTRAAAVPPRRPAERTAPPEAKVIGPVEIADAPDAKEDVLVCVERNPGDPIYCIDDPTGPQPDL